MPQAIFVFDFGTNEDAAQQARHKIEGWKQGFRLGNKMMLKFERTETATEGGKEASAEEEKAPAKGKSGKKAEGKKTEKAEKAENSGNVRLLVRLSFSDHEKLTYQRWIDRIPGEEVFKPAKAQALRTGDPEFPKTAELFDSLD